MKLNTRGLSLLEVLMSLSVLSVITVSTMQLTEYFSRSSARIDSRLGHVRLLSELRASLTNRDTCLHTLVKKDFEPGANSPIKLRLDAASFDPTKPKKFNPAKVISSQPPQNRRPEYKLTITKLELANKQLVYTYPSGDLMYWAQVHLEASEMGNKGTAFRGGPVASLLFKVDDSGDIIDCLIGEAPLDGKSATCQMLGGIMIGDRCQMRSDRVEVVCPDGKYLAGFTNTGGKDCRDLPTPPTVPSPPIPVCTQVPQAQGPGQGATPRAFASYACQASCLGTYGPGSSCVGGCTMGYRGWMFCGQCETKVWVCK